MAGTAGAGSIPGKTVITAASLAPPAYSAPQRVDYISLRARVVSGSGTSAFGRGGYFQQAEEPTMIHPTIKSKNYIDIHKSFGIAAATALVVAIAAPGAGHAEYRLAGHPAHENAAPRPPMRPLQTGTVVAAPAARAQPPRVIQSAPSVAMGHAEDTGHAGDRSHDRGHDSVPRDARIIVVGVPSTYYYGAPTYYAPGYDSDQYSDGGPALGPSPLGDVNATSCALAYSSYDPQSGTYIGDDGIAHPCP